jgi:hypothetical protein
MSEAKSETLPAVVEKPKTPMLAGGAVQAIVPRDHVEASRFASAIWKSGLAPSSYKDAEQVSIGIMCGLELGVPPMQALSGIAIINNRPAVWGDLAVALAQRNGTLVNHESLFEGEEGTDSYTAIFRAWRKGQPNPYEGKFSVGDAKRAKLWANSSKQPWILYPSRMLFNRARAFALRNGFADCLKGLAIAEEVRDLEAPVEREVKSTAFLDDTSPVQDTNPAIPLEACLED